MRISAIKLNNFRCFANASIELSEGINLVVGTNNSGKSTLLKSVAWIQYGTVISTNDLRVLQNEGFVQIKLLNPLRDYFPQNTSYIKINLLKGYMTGEFIAFHDQFYRGVEQQNLPLFDNRNEYCHNIPNAEPSNFIYPYLSRRKVASYQELINLQNLHAVTGDFSNLYAKIDRLSNPEMPSHKEYIEACDEILGFRLTTTASNNGKKAVYLINNYESIPMESMGEGTPSLIGLIVDLCIAQNKLFLIEEPENDVNPKALKKLLKLITEKSKINQFIITTHSNIVVKYLGSQSESKLFRLRMNFEDKIPTSSIEEIDNSPASRIEVLEELGYEFFDFDIWSAWLILEEASAEKIIREYLIPWFTSELNGKLRTFSARSVSEVEKKVEDFNSLFVFLHLQPVYRNLAWVVIDAGNQEKEIIEKLKKRYMQSGWREENFLQFNEHDFERYYPHQFKSDIDNVLNIETNNNKGKQLRREGKNNLLAKVEKWIEENPTSAKEAFKVSAANVIEILCQIESTLLRSKKLK
jgi:AAA15 family ATPase/GTPase